MKFHQIFYTLLLMVFITSSSHAMSSEQKSQLLQKIKEHFTDTSEVQEIEIKSSNGSKIALYFDNLSIANLNLEADADKCALCGKVFDIELQSEERITFEYGTPISCHGSCLQTKISPTQDLSKNNGTTSCNTRILPVYLSGGLVIVSLVFMAGVITYIFTYQLPQYEGYGHQESSPSPSSETSISSNGRWWFT